jgi:hypothetical protein
VWCANPNCPPSLCPALPWPVNLIPQTPISPLLPALPIFAALVHARSHARSGVPTIFRDSCSSCSRTDYYYQCHATPHNSRRRTLPSWPCTRALSVSAICHASFLFSNSSRWTSAMLLRDDKHASHAIGPQGRLEPYRTACGRDIDAITNKTPQHGSHVLGRLSVSLHQRLSDFCA